MKRLVSHAFDPIKARLQWQELDTLLKSKQKLRENDDILPFFRNRHDLSLLIGNYFPNIRRPDVFAHEFPIFGDFRADLVVGDSRAHHYLLIEFEDGAADSLFRTGSAKANPDWSPRFEAAFSQLVDWTWKLEDMRATATFADIFGSRNARFQGMIVIGKDMSLDRQEQSRLQWRNDKVLLDSNKISCISFDQLNGDIDFWLSAYHAA